MNFLQNGTLTTYQYDMANRLTEIEHSAHGTPFYTVGYTLNSVGNCLPRLCNLVALMREMRWRARQCLPRLCNLVALMREMRWRARQCTSKSLSGSAVFNGPVTVVYDYDAIDQLIEADYGTGKIEGFQYDPVGNREQVALTESGSTTTTSYTANALNQYTAVGTDLPSYDARGNLTSQSGWTYAYDSKNRLLSATDGTTTASFVYDYRNRQVSRTIDGETMYFVWDDWSLLEDRDGQFDVQQQYVHGPVIDEILVKVAAGIEVAYYHRDGLQSAVALTDAAGAPIETYRYDAFGEVEIRDDLGAVQAASTASNRFVYTGREWIEEVNLMDYRNRVYSTALGRFLQTDPIRFEAIDINLYRYVANRPISYNDPLGLFGPWGAIGGGVLGAWADLMSQIGCYAIQKWFRFTH